MTTGSAASKFTISVSFCQKGTTKLNKDKYYNSTINGDINLEHTSFTPNFSSMISVAFLPISFSKGVNAIDSTTIIIRSLFNSSGRTPSLFQKALEGKQDGTNNK